jgi:hypothetical protein
LPKWVDVTAHVKCGDGQPAAGALVAVPRSSVPVPELALLADATGLVRFRLPSGCFTIEAYTEGGGKGRIDVAVVGDAPVFFELHVKEPSR